MLPGMIKEAFQEGKNNASQANNGEDVFAKIEKLKKLLDMGAITQEEFDKKKAEWLGKL
jgi:hypothetical protein